MKKCSNCNTYEKYNKPVLKRDCENLLHFDLALEYQLVYVYAISTKYKRIYIFKKIKKNHILKLTIKIKRCAKNCYNTMGFARGSPCSVLLAFSQSYIEHDLTD
jgi:hypothetical protein